MGKRRSIARSIIVLVIIALLAGILPSSEIREEWRVAEDGSLEYLPPAPEYSLISSKAKKDANLYEISFLSRGASVACLLRMPLAQRPEGVSGVVLLSGATVTKEQEQRLAEFLSGLGYASIALDQRNLGCVDMQRDLEKFLDGKEPTEHKMVHDALAAAEVLRMQPEIDPGRIVYVGESNGGRFAIIASALDPKARGVVAISTCGYGVEEEIDSLRMNDPDTVKFFRSIDPDTYLGRIPPRRFVMIHSLNDSVIPFDYANRTYEKALEPKDMYIVECATHGRCKEMDPYLEEELARMVS